jgi:hypothetical protein
VAARTRPSVATQLPLLPAIVLALLPKCPLCFAAWFGLLGAAGASSWLSAAWGAPLGMALLSFAVAALALRARKTRDLRPLLMGVIGAGALLGGKYVADLLLLCAGLALLIAASIWSTAVRTSNRVFR